MGGYSGGGQPVKGHCESEAMPPSGKAGLARGDLASLSPVLWDLTRTPRINIIAVLPTGQHCSFRRWWRDTLVLQSWKNNDRFSCVEGAPHIAGAVCFSEGPEWFFSGSFPLRLNRLGEGRALCLFKSAVI